MAWLFCATIGDYAVQSHRSSGLVGLVCSVYAMSDNYKPLDADSAYMYVGHLAIKTSDCAYA